MRREERLVRKHRKTLEWQTKQICRKIMMGVVEDAMMELRWRQQTCRDIVVAMVEDAVLESRMKLCRQILEETVLERSWESLEITRILNEVKDGGRERMNKVEANLRDQREEMEAALVILAEKDAILRRIEKTDRLQKAWRLKMDYRKCQRMISMMEELSVTDLEMEMDWIESKVLEMMELEDQDEDYVSLGEKDKDGDQVMPQEEPQTGLEEGYSLSEMDFTVCVTEVGEEAHTPVPGSNLCTDNI